MSNRIQSWKPSRSVGRFLLIDLLIDKQARPIFGYAAVIIVFGAVIYHFVEGWNWLDSLYFVIVTTTTIGYGDFSPKTDLGKILTIFFALNGVAILIMLFDQIRRVRASSPVASNAMDDGKDNLETTANHK